MRVLAMAWRQLRRELRAGELHALAGALIIAVAALTAVGAFGERVEGGLLRSANELLGGDLVVVSRREIPAAWRQRSRELGLAVTTAVEFPTVAFAGERSMLVEVKAVGEGYPLRGAVEIAPDPASPGRRADRIPAPGTAWVDPRVLGELEVRLGDELELGSALFRIEALVRLEPDRSGVFNLAPRVLIPAGDLDKTGLLGAGSRARYRLMVAGNPGELEAFRSWLEPRREGASFQTLKESQGQLSASLDRANRFLALAALSAVLLAGAALVLAAREFALRHVDTVAVLRCLGASQFQALAMLGVQLLWLAIPAVAVGIGIGYGVQALLVWAMGDLIPEALPAAGPAPALAGTLTGLLALLGFGLPPLIRLRHVPPARVLRRQDGPLRLSDWLVYLPAGIFAVALIYWQAGEWPLGTYITLGLVGTLAILAAAALAVIATLRLFRGSGGLGWRYGLANLARHRVSNLFQIAGLGLGAMLIFLLSVVQADLLESWRGTLPERAPNFFLLNIQPDQAASVEAALAPYGRPDVFPMAVGRITAINGVPPSEDQTRRSRRLDGTTNLSWAQDLPAGNEIIAGEWWKPASKRAEVSLAESWAERVGIGIGDRLTFRVGATGVEATVSSIRRVDWDSFEVNFFILLSPGLLGEVPATYLTSLYLPPEQFAVIGELVRTHPNISVIDVGTILARVRTIIDRVSLTVQVVFLFTLAAGVLVLLSALRAGLGARIYEGAVLRTLGAARHQLQRALLAEFGVIGTLAGGLAAAAALGTGWLVARQVFEMPYAASWTLIPLGALVGGMAIALIGTWGGRGVLTAPPVSVLRRG